MIRTYPMDAYREDTAKAYEMSEGLARAYRRKFGMAVALTPALARAYLLTLPENEEIDQLTPGKCLGARIIRWLHPNALENDLSFVAFGTSTGSYDDGAVFWHVHASYDFTDLMWQSYSNDIAPSGIVTVRDLLKLVDEYDNK